MFKNLISFLRFDKNTRLQCRHVIVENPTIRLNYVRALFRIRHKKEPIRVLFLVSELSKWKAMEVFRLMQTSPDFEPILGLTIADRDWELTKDEQCEKHRQLTHYFAEQGINVVETFSIEDGHPYSIKQFKPDIVFYQQPWGIAKSQSPKSVSKIALTCYVPYFVPNYGFMEMDAKLRFLSTLFRYYTLNTQWVKLLKKAQLGCLRTTTYVASGHPMLDYFTENQSPIPRDGVVIYAPHWSIKHPLNADNDEFYSTFLDNGEKILQYAQKHPEIKWAFKPHPTLRAVLQQEGIWGKERTDAYYAAWEKIGVSCYTGDYPKLFNQSRLMITDCASFLCEYASTMRPLIRLVSPNLGFQPIQEVQPLFNSFYNAHSFEELLQFLDTLIVDGKDPKRDERIQCATDYGLLESCAAAKIFADIKTFCKK